LVYPSIAPEKARVLSAVCNLYSPAAQVYDLPIINPCYMFRKPCSVWACVCAIYTPTIYIIPFPVQALYSRLCSCYLAIALTPVKSLQQSLAWPPRSLSLLYLLCWASPCPMLREFSLTRFRMTSASWLHNFVVKPYEYGILKVICSWGFVVRFGKVAVLNALRREKLCHRYTTE